MTRYYTIRDRYTSKDLVLTKAEAMRAHERAKAMKKKVVKNLEKITFSKVKGVSERSLFELQGVLRYQKGLKKGRS